MSEIADLRVQDISLETRMSVKSRGKGRKNRSVPLWRETVKLLRVWLQQPNRHQDSPLLPNARGNPMTRSCIAQRLKLAVKHAALSEPSLGSMQISPHIIRHTTAMHLLQSGVDLSVIAMWLGHETTQTTHQYLDADLETKKLAQARLKSPRIPREKRSRGENIMQFLKGL